MKPPFPSASPQLPHNLELSLPNLAPENLAKPNVEIEATKAIWPLSCRCKSLSRSPSNVLVVINTFSLLHTVPSSLLKNIDMPLFENHAESRGRRVVRSFLGTSATAPSSILLLANST
jgi:hypothetical protein